jgi:hypothetical protein
VSEAQPLRLVDPATGEIHERACPRCQTLDYQLGELTRKYHGLLAQLGNLRADKAQEAQASPLWGWGIAVFQEWKTATGHLKSVWTPDRFEVCKGALEDYGFADCRYAVWGLAANCFSKRVTAGYEKRYDEFWRVFGPSAGVQSADHFEGHVNAGRAIFGGDLPEGEWDRLLWVHRRRA